MVIAETGGWPGLRDGAMLHAAVARPFASFGGEDLYPDDFTKAAALFHSLIKSHPFMDGTKRTAFAAALYLLAQMGHSLPDAFPLTAVVNFCVSVAEENMRATRGEPVRPRTIAEIAEWFRQLFSVPTT